MDKVRKPSISEHFFFFIGVLFTFDLPQTRMTTIQLNEFAQNARGTILKYDISKCTLGTVSKTVGPTHAPTCSQTRLYTLTDLLQAKPKTVQGRKFYHRRTLLPDVLELRRQNVGPFRVATYAGFFVGIC
jgi:hypothetical protein